MQVGKGTSHSWAQVAADNYLFNHDLLLVTTYSIMT